MTVHRMFFVVVLTIMITAGVLAQPRNGEGRAEAQIKRLQEKVGLTDEQTVKVKAILQKVPRGGTEGVRERRRRPRSDARDDDEEQGEDRCRDHETSHQGTETKI
jgi:hypothetical protein